MSWTVRLLGSTVYVATDSEGAAPLANLPSTGWVDVPILGANTELARESEVVRYSNRVVRAIARHSVRRATLTTVPYRFPEDDAARRALEELLIGSLYLWIDWNDYPGRLCPPDFANAVELETLEIEHSWETGTKTLRVSLLVTRR